MVSSAATGLLSCVVATILGLVTLTLLADERPQRVLADGQTFYARTADGEMGGDVVNQIEAPDALPSRLSALSLSSSAIAAAPTTPPYPFFPQAGTLWQDLYVSNFVDLGSGVTPLDHECTEFSYVGHNGHDSTIAGFREQAIGVPVFAALDGTVISAHDGEFDENTTNLLFRPGNFVVLAHAGGFSTQYYHFKKNSLAVSVGQVVRAGTQLGLTGSSGNSSWPHLHFTSLFNGVAFEPHAGPCRSGPSYWVNQVAIRRDPHVRTWTFGNAPFSGNAGYPYDQVARTGSYALGTSIVYFRMMLGTLPAQSSCRIVILRADGAVASDSSGPFNNQSVLRHPQYWFSRNVSLNTVGTWSVDFYVNSTKIASAPFSVVATAAQIINRPPLAVATVAFDPALPTTSDVPFCRVTPASLYGPDPDYDLVRYRYRWEISGTLVRDVTTAGIADALPRGLVRAGDRLTCTVTPYDDSTAGPSTSVTSDLSALAGPTGLVATAAGTSVTLTWTAPAGGAVPDTYIIEAGSSAGTADLANFSTGTTATTFFATGVRSGTYYVRVRAANVAGTSGPSNEAILVVGGGACAAAPGAPSSLRVVSINGGTVALAWNAAAGNPASYIVEAGSGPGATNLANSDLGSVATSLTATGVARGIYFARIRAKNLCGVSATSNEVIVNVP
jgi:hypothetical protein